jgi:hypothetical protein
MALQQATAKQIWMLLLQQQMLQTSTSNSHPTSRVQALGMPSA